MTNVLSVPNQTHTEKYQEQIDLLETFLKNFEILNCEKIETFKTNIQIRPKNIPLNWFHIISIKGKIKAKDY